MANVKEKAEWAGVYMIGDVDDIRAGKQGPDTKPIENFANRTRYLKNKIGDMEGLLWRIWN
jgi:hypothetical protein